MRLVYFCIIFALSVTIFANTYTRNSMHMAHSYYVKMDFVLNFLENTYKDDPTFQLINESVATGKQEITQLFQEKGLAIPEYYYLKELKFEGQLQACRFALETEFGHQKTMEFLNDKVDDVQIKDIFRRLKVLGRDKLIPFLRECEGKHEA